MDLGTFNVELILSGKAAKVLRVKPTERASTEPVHFLAQWRVELAVDASGQKLLLITNAVTVYSILIPLQPKMRFEEVATQFLMRLRFLLLGVNPPVDWKPGEVRAVRGGTPSLIGTMNNMVYLLGAGRREARALHEEEDFLNDTPFFAIPENFPRKAFYSRLGEVPPARAPWIALQAEAEAETASAPPGVGKILRILEQHRAEDQGTQADRAQQLYYDAMDAASATKKLSLLRKALRLDPENADVRLALLAEWPLPPVEEVVELRAILAMAAHKLGPAMFQQCKGAFWGVIETRPYMRARMQLAETLRSMGRTAEAIAEWQAMLELNPSDNQGVRYLLLPELVAHGDLKAASAIFSQYPECEFSTIFAWCRVLERFLRKDLPGAEQALRGARKQNPYTEAYINGRKRLPKTTFDAYSPGSPEEAVCSAAILHHCWAKQPEAVKWLKTRRGAE